MIDSKTISDMVQNLVKALPPGVKNAPKDIEKTFKAILVAGFERLDLVTREEFDVQQKVLQKTRAKLEKLEADVKTLEAKHKPKSKSRQPKE